MDLFSPSCASLRSLEWKELLTFSSSCFHFPHDFLVGKGSEAKVLPIKWKLADIFGGISIIFKDVDSSLTHASPTLLSTFCYGMWGLRKVSSGMNLSGLPLLSAILIVKDFS